MKNKTRSIVQNTSIFCITILAWMVSVTHLSAADSEATERAQIWQCLKGYEWNYSAECFDGVGSDVSSVLMDLASTPSLMNAYRFRALKALGMLNIAPDEESDANETVSTFLESYIQNSSRGSLVRRAFDSLQKVAPQRAGRTAESLVGHDDPHVRIAAIRQLQVQDNLLNRSFSNGDLEELIAKEEQWIQKRIRE